MMEDRPMRDREPTLQAAAAPTRTRILKLPERAIARVERALRLATGIAFLAAGAYLAATRLFGVTFQVGARALGNHLDGTARGLQR
jgi:hypothetical protein